jgi:alpha-L-fucosidase
MFLHVTHWPESGQLRLPGLATSVRRVKEDGATAQLNWRWDGDDLVVTLPEQPRDQVLPVIRVELGGQLRIIPANTVALDRSSGAAVLDSADFEQGSSYADDGNYSSTHRTTVRSTAYLTADRAEQVSVVVRGQARADALYRLQVGQKSRLVKGSEVTQGAVGPFLVLPGRVTPVTITLAQPEHAGEELELRLDAMLVAPSGAVVGWAQAPQQLAAGARADIPVHVTNLGNRPANGALTLRVPDGWTTGTGAEFTGVAPGRTHTVSVPVTVPADADTGLKVLQTTVTGGGRPLGLSSQVEVVLPNVAQGKAATQSSTAWGGVPGRAVDGNTAGEYLVDNTASHTAEPSHQAWWQVDLGQQYAVQTIEIWNRTDCCMERLSDYWVLVSDSPFTTDSLEEARLMPGVTAVHLDEPAGRPTRVDHGGTRGRYIRIQLESATDPLSLTEVVVRAR